MSEKIEIIDWVGNPLFWSEDIVKDGYFNVYRSRNGVCFRGARCASSEEALRIRGRQQTVRGDQPIYLIRVKVSRSAGHD